MHGLAGKVAVVTGMTATMGATIGRRLAAEGAAVVGMGRSAAAGEEIAAGIVADGGRAAFVTGDLTSAADIEAAVEEAVARFGGLDIVVNNAAAVDLVRDGQEAPLAEVAPETFERQLRVGLHGPFLLARAAIPHMMRRSGGAFVSLSSIGAHRAHPGMTGYAPTKAALEALDRQIAMDYGAHGIRANTVVVGRIRVSHNVGVHDDPVLGAALRDETQMLPTTGRPEDIAAAVAFLASAEAAFITGVTLHVDGGSAAKASVSGTTFVQWRAGLAAQAGA